MRRQYLYDKFNENEPQQMSSFIRRQCSRSEFEKASLT